MPRDHVTIEVDLRSFGRLGEDDQRSDRRGRADLQPHGADWPARSIAATGPQARRLLFGRGRASHFEC